MKKKSTTLNRILCASLAALLASGSVFGSAGMVVSAEEGGAPSYMKFTGASAKVAAPAYNYANLPAPNDSGDTTEYWFGGNAFYRLPQDPTNYNKNVPWKSGTQIATWELVDTDHMWDDQAYSIIWNETDANANYILDYFETNVWSQDLYMNTAERKAVLKAKIAATQKNGGGDDSNYQLSANGLNPTTMSEEHLFVPSYYEYKSNAAASKAIGSGYAWTRSYAKNTSGVYTTYGPNNYPAPGGTDTNLNPDLYNIQNNGSMGWYLNASGELHNTSLPWATVTANNNYRQNYGYSSTVDAKNGRVLKFSINPAMYLDLKQIVMAKDNKAIGSAVEATSDFQTYDMATGSMKFELQDTEFAPNFTTEIDDLKLTNATKGETYTVAYKNAQTEVPTPSQTGDKLFVSAIIYNKDGGVEYYAPLKEITEDDGTSGTVTMTLPATLENDKQYTLAIFEEQVSGTSTFNYANADHVMYETDYQSGNVSLSSFKVTDTIKATLKDASSTLRDQTSYTADDIAAITDVVYVDGTKEGAAYNVGEYYFMAKETFDALPAYDEETVKANSGLTTREISEKDGAYTQDIVFIVFAGTKMMTTTMPITVEPDPSEKYSEWNTSTWYTYTQNGIEWIYKLNDTGDIAYIYTTSQDFSSIVDAGGNLNLPTAINGLTIHGLGGGETTKPVVPSTSPSWRAVKKITIPHTVTQINKAAFYGWQANAQVVIPSTVEMIASKAFYSSNVTKLVMNNAKANIAYRSFANCKKLAAVKVSGEGISIDKEAFSGSGIKDLNLNGTIVVDDKAFNNNASLVNLYIPEGVTAKAYSFANLTGLNKLQVASSNIENFAFDGCVNIAYLIVDASTQSLPLNWNGNEGNYVNRQVYVLNKTTTFETQAGVGSAFGGPGSDIAVFYPKTEDASAFSSEKGDVTEANCRAYDDNGEMRTLAQGKADTIIFNGRSVDTNELLKDESAKLTEQTEVQTDIEAYYTGSVIEKMQLNKESMTVSRIYGYVTNGTYTPDQFYVIRANDYAKLYESNTVTRENVAALEPVTAKTSDLAGAESATLPVVVVAFDENGSYGIDEKYFATELTVRIDKYTSDTVVGEFGSYEGILKKIEELQGQIATLEGEKKDYASLVESYKAMIKDLTASVTVSDEEIQKLKDQYAELEDQSSEEATKLKEQIEALEKEKKDATSNLSGYIGTLKTQIEDLQTAYNAMSDKKSEDAKLLLEKIETLKEQKNAAENVASQIEEVNKQIKAVEAENGSLVEKLAETQKKYDEIVAELKNMGDNYNNKNIEFVTKDNNGKLVVIIDGAAYEFDEATATDYVYEDELGKHTVKKYVAKDGFEFFTTLEGVTVVKGNGNVAQGKYTDSLYETMMKAEEKLAECNTQLVALTNEINEVCAALNDAGFTVNKGATDAETMQNIKNTLRDVAKEYSAMKEQYTNLKVAVYGDLSKEELDKKSVEDLVEKIGTVSADAGKIEAEIESALTGGNVSAEDAQALSALLNDIRTMRESLEADKQTFDDIKKVLNVTNDEEVLQTITDLYKQLEDAKQDTTGLDELKAQIVALQQANAQLQAQVTALTAENAQLKGQVSNGGQTTTPAPSYDASQARTIAELSSKVATLSADNDSLKSKVNTLSSDNDTLKNKVNNLTSSNESLTGQVNTLQNSNQNLQSELASVKQQRSSSSYAGGSTKTSGSKSSGKASDDADKPTTKKATVSLDSKASDDTKTADDKTGNGSKSLFANSKLASKNEEMKSSVPTGKGEEVGSLLEKDETTVVEETSIEAGSESEEGREGHSKANVGTIAAKKGMNTSLLTTIAAALLGGIAFTGYKLFGTRKKAVPAGGGRVSASRRDDIDDDDLDDDDYDDDDEDDEDYDF